MDGVGGSENTEEDAETGKVNPEPVLQPKRGRPYLLAIKQSMRSCICIHQKKAHTKPNQSDYLQVSRVSMMSISDLVGSYRLQNIIPFLLHSSVKSLLIPIT